MNSHLPIAEMNAESFERHVLHSELPVLVAVCANGSRASQKLLALLEDWTPKARGRINLVQVNAADSPELAQRCGVPSVPGIALFHHGAICYQFTGELSQRELDDLLGQADLLAQSAPLSAGRSTSPAPESN